MEEIQQVDKQKPSYSICKIVLGVFVVCFAIACFCLGIYAMSFAVTFYSYLFSLLDELSAKAYLRQNFTSHMALLYFGIIGMVLVTINTMIYFITFRQKAKLIFLHIVFYLGIFILGLVSIAGSSDYNNQLKYIVTQQGKIVLTVEATQFEKDLYPYYSTYRSDLIAFYASYCVFFFFYMVFHFVGSKYEEYLEANDNFSHERLQQNHSQISMNKEKKVIFEAENKIQKQQQMGQK